MIKSKVFRVLFFVFLVAGTPFISWGSTITKEYCQTLIDSAINEHSKKNYAKSIEILIKTKDFAEANGWISIKIKSLHWLGFICHRASDYKKAMDYYMEAYQLVLNEPDMKTSEAKILNNIAGLYSIDKKYDMAIEYYQKALLICQYINNTTVMASIFNNLGIIANELNNMDLAIQYTDSTLKISQDIPFDRKTHAQQIKAQALYQKQEYIAAEKLALEAFQQIQNYEKEYQQIVPFILLITKIYQGQNKNEEALVFVKKSLEYNPNLQDIIEIYEQMAILYQKNQLPDLALAYKDSVIVLKDSLHKINAFIDSENSYIRIELLNSEKELSENKAKQKAERLLFLVVVIAIFILAMIFIWILRIQSIRNRQRKQITELELQQEKSRKLIVEQELKEKETLALLKQEQLNNEIEIKNKQLTARILFQTNRTELIRKLIEAFSNTSFEKKNPILESIIQELRLQLKDSTDANNFFTQLEQVNPSLFLLIKEKHPTLSMDDIQLLSYIYLHNTDTKKIAALLNISVSACQKRKERLAGKMDIRTIDIFNYLYNLMNFAISNGKQQEL